MRYSIKASYFEAYLFGLFAFIFIGEASATEINISSQTDLDNPIISHPSGQALSLSGLTATLRIKNNENLGAVDNHVRLSAKGMFVSQPDGRYEVIKNYEIQKTWLSNSRLKKIHEVDIPYYEEYFPSQVKYFKSPGTVSNVLGSQVCSEYKGVFKGQRVWRNQVVYEWDCMADEGYLVDTQLFSDRWKMVVKASKSNFGTVELVDIVEIDDASYSYKPNPYYEQVGFEEFVTGRLTLEDYRP